MSRFLALFTIGFFIFIPCISCMKLGPGPETLPSRQRSLSSNEVTLSGTVYDRNGNPMPGADVQLKAPDFSEIHMTKTDENGQYFIKAKPGTYFSFYACRDYGEKNLEYWGWDIPLHDDLTLDAFVDRLEI